MMRSKLSPLSRQVREALFGDKKPVIRVLAANRCTNIPDNVQGWYVQEMEDSQKSQSTIDRSREVSGQQTSQMFSAGFMNSQGQKEDVNISGEGNCETPYDVDGNAHLESVLLTNVPEPYHAESEKDLKEGLPEGLSDCVRSRGQRWTMEDRLDQINHGHH